MHLLDSVSYNEKNSLEALSPLVSQPVTLGSSGQQDTPGLFGEQDTPGPSEQQDIQRTSSRRFPDDELQPKKMRKRITEGKKAGMQWSKA